jgi:hypothetical protein
MKSRTSIRFAPLQIALLTLIILICGCNSPTESPSGLVKSVLQASGAIYGTPFSFNDTISAVGYRYIDTVWSGLFPPTTNFVNQDQLSFVARSITGGYVLDGGVRTEGKGSMTPGQYTLMASDIQIRQTTDASDEQQTRTIDKEVVTVTEATPYSKIAGSFELRWHYKYDTTRVGYVTGTFSYEKHG